jgi:hypothetical protein
MSRKIENDASSDSLELVDHVAAAMQTPGSTEATRAFTHCEYSRCAASTDKLTHSTCEHGGQTTPVGGVGDGTVQGLKSDSSPVAAAAPLPCGRTGQTDYTGLWKTGPGIPTFPRNIR